MGWVRRLARVEHHWGINFVRIIEHLCYIVHVFFSTIHNLWELMNWTLEFKVMQCSVLVGKLIGIFSHTLTWEHNLLNGPQRSVWVVKYTSTCLRSVVALTLALSDTINIDIQICQPCFFQWNLISLFKTIDLKLKFHSLHFILRLLNL